MSVEETLQARPRSSRTSLWLNASLSLIAFALLAWTVRSNREKLGEVWARRPDPWLFALGLALYVAALLVTFLRWHRLVRALGLPFRVRDAIRLGFIGNVFNLVIPGAVGGDVIKAGFLCREQEKKTQAVASMVIDRAVGLLGLFVLAGAVGLFAWRGATVEVRRLIGFSWLMTATGSAGLAVLFTPTLNTLVLRLVRGRGKLEAMAVELVAMASSYRERFGVVLLAIVMAVIGHAMYVLCFYLAGRGLFGSEAPSPLDCYLVVPLVLFSTAIPMPFGALGVSEQVSRSLFVNIVGFANGDIAMLGYRVIMYAAGLVSVLVYLANARQVREIRQSS